MDQIRFGILLRTIILQCFITRNAFSIQKREWTDTTTAKLTEGHVACFSEYMEMWIPSVRIEGLRVWLSGALRIQGNLAALDHLNLQLSACGFSLYKDPDKNFIFRVSYTGCFVQQQQGHRVLTLNLVRRISRFGGRTHSFIMKCPMVSVLPSREQIQCDPEFIQVTRHVPRDIWDTELHWSLSLSDHLIVALEDASLIQMSADMSGPDMTVQGRRRDILSPIKVMGHEGEFLALKLVSGQYAYSMEATCPEVITASAEETVMHIFKRRMGLTKRGSQGSDALTVSEVSVNQTDHFTVQETSKFVTLNIPTAQILQTKACADSKQLLQPFYRVDVVLTFKETNHKMHWTMENTLPCTARPAHSTSSAGPGTTAEFTTTNPPHTLVDRPSVHTDEVSKSQSGNFSSGLNGDRITSISAAERSSFGFQNAAVNASAEPGFLESSTTAEPSEMSVRTSGNNNQHKQKRLSWIWE